MSFLARRRTRLASLLRNLFHKEDVERDLDDEMRSHLDLLTDRKIAQGATPEEARHAALREMGGVEQVKEHVRDARAGTILETIWQDLRHGARMLRRRPGFTFFAVLTLALGIGANTAIFTVVHAVLLEPLPYPHADRLAIVWSAWGKESRGPASGPELVHLKERSRLFRDLAGIWVTGSALTGERDPEQVRLGQVTSNFLSLLCSRPQLGRLFLASEQGPSAPPVVVLTDGLWRRKFSADPGILGSAIHLDGRPFTVVGVLPPRFELLFPDDASVPPDVQIYMPFHDDLASIPRDVGYIRVIGRLRDGVTLMQAQGEADAIAARLRSEFAEFGSQNLNLRVASLHADNVRNVKPILLALFGGVGLVLLIACANVANLMLSRAKEREKEMTVRTALGASPGRIARQLLIESLLLSCLGGVAALAVGRWSIAGLVSLWPQATQRMAAIEFDWTVLAFTLFLSVVTGIVFGLAPARRAVTADLVETLKEGSRSVSSPRRSGSLLVASEVALGFVLVVGAGLMARTFTGLLRVDPGFDPARAVTFRVSLPRNRYSTPEEERAFVKTLQDKIRALPSVVSAGASSHVPFDESLPNWYSPYWPEGAAEDQQNTVMADHRSVLPGYLPSLGATFVEGRNFEDSDDASHRYVIIVDDWLARRTWPGQSAVGKRLSVETSAAGNYQFARDWAEVVGVVKHVQYHSLSEGVRPQIYLPFPLAVRPHMTFVVRTAEDPETLVEPLRREVAKLDKDMPISNVRTLDDYVAAARARTRFLTMLAAFLAGVALLLACVGIYGVASRSVLARTTEIGVRAALGAQRSQLLGMVVAQGIAPAVIGLLLGAVLSVAVTPLLSALLFGVKPIDPVTIAAGAVLFLAVSLAACAIPAWRAVRIDPIAALRHT